MAESSLSIGYPELQRTLARFLGFSTDPAKRNDLQNENIDDDIQSGVRQVYYPPKTGNEPPHIWPFLQPTTTLVIASGENEADAPDDFQAPIGNIRLESDTERHTVRQTSESTIRNLLATNDTMTGPPDLYAVRWDSSDGTSGQRAVIMFFPVLNSDRTLSMTYEAYQGKLDADHPYPLGGMMMAELFKESCLAVAEQRDEGEKGIHWESFNQHLRGVMDRDSGRKARHYGNMGNPNGLGCAPINRSTGEVFYNGVPIL